MTCKGNNYNESIMYDLPSGACVCVCVCVCTAQCREALCVYCTV